MKINIGPRAFRKPIYTKLMWGVKFYEIIDLWNSNFWTEFCAATDVLEEANANVRELLYGIVSNEITGPRAIWWTTV